MAVDTIGICSIVKPQSRELGQVPTYSLTVQEQYLHFC